MITTPAQTTETIKVSDLRTNPKNPRIIRDPQFFRLVASVRDFPKMMTLRPMVFDRETMSPIGGNQRLAAIKHLKMIDIPRSWIVFADDLSSDEKREFMIKDNLSFGDWDTDTLANEWDLDVINGWGLEVKGTKVSQRVEEDDFVPAIENVKPVSKPGDLYQLNDHRIFCGDNQTVANVNTLMTGRKADLVWMDLKKVTIQDPAKKPQKDQDEISEAQLHRDLASWLKNLKRHTKESAPFYFSHQHNIAAHLERAMSVINIQVRATIIWNKSIGSMGWTDYRQKHTPIFYASFKGAKVLFYGDRSNTTVWSETWDHARIEKELKAIAKKQDQGDSTVWTVGRDTSAYLIKTQQPLELIGIAIRNSSRKGDLLLDLNIGPGSSLLAAEQTGRICHGMDSDPLMIDNTVRRWFTWMTANHRELRILRNGKDISNTKWITGRI